MWLTVWLVVETVNIFRIFCAGSCRTGRLVSAGLVSALFLFQNFMLGGASNK